MTLDVLKVIIPSFISFFVGIGITPILTSFLYKKKMWKKSAKTVSLDGRGTPIFNSLHKEKETNTPRMGGIVIWFSTIVVALGTWLLSNFSSSELIQKLDFISRDQTWIPLAVLLIGAIVGLLDDFLEVKGTGGHKAGGLSLIKRLFVIAGIGFFVSVWFYKKLEVDTVSLLWFPELFIGWFIIPFFTFVILSLYAGGVIDGLDGLSGGVFASIFTAYTVLAFTNGQINLAALCATIVGGILAFTWFNIPPARFYMSETGSMALTATLGVIAFMTDRLGDGVGLSVLPIIAMPLVVTVITSVIQILSKKFRNGKKVFLVAPIHHHFEAIGWPSYKVTMRYWIISIIFAILGLIIALSS